jgi:ribosome-associated translation inhibitor RaiA
MKISIRVKNLERTPRLKDEVERVITFAVDRYSTQVREITLYLTDVNGEKGGVDKLCQITAYLRGQDKPVLILQRGAEILAAVNRAANRLRRRIGNRIRRVKQPAAREFRASVRTASN